MKKSSNAQPIMARNGRNEWAPNENATVTATASSKVQAGVTSTADGEGIY
jgi:hypothetical protein